MKNTLLSKRNIKKIATLLIAGVVYLVQQNYNSNSKSNTENTTTVASSSLIYTKHALCRMDCRGIDKAEIKYVISMGKVNTRKSNTNSKPCPTLALEARSKRDKQKIRVVLANCPVKSKVITVIDLENKYNCHCDYFFYTSNYSEDAGSLFSINNLSSKNSSASFKSGRNYCVQYLQ